ncbi:MAG: cell wall-active antibiotics response protein [Bacteroidales bacterium]|nr:cell wall-active antibiotics response protein [Bacteroidales bacterium]
MENNENVTVHRGMNRKSLVFGLLVLGLGFAWLLHNFGLIGDRAWDVIFSWQMLLIAIGIVNVANDSHRGVGWILIAIGGFFMVSEYYDLPTSFRHVFWPALLIVIGLVLIFGTGKMCRRRGRWIGNGTGSGTGSDFSFSKGEDFIEEVAVFGGGDRVINSQAFRGGKIVTIFGGSKIDLTRAQLAEGPVEIEVVAIFGGSTLLLPTDWNVKLEVFNIFGGYGDKRVRGQVDFNKTVLVKGVAIFGGGEIKSY